MNAKEFKNYVESDLYRYYGRLGASSFIKAYFKEAGFKYTFWMRLGEYLHQKPLTRYTLYILAKYWHYRLTYKLGISIPIGTDIGPGLYIGHFGTIVVNGQVKMGRNCNLSQGVTIGQSNRGRYAGVPTIGHCVYFGPGSKVVGKIHVGDNAVVGANAVVVTNIKNDEVCGGIPATAISSNGNSRYIENILVH